MEELFKFLNEIKTEPPSEYNIFLGNPYTGTYNGWLVEGSASHSFGNYYKFYFTVKKGKRVGEWSIYNFDINNLNTDEFTTFLNRAIKNARSEKERELDRKRAIKRKAVAANKLQERLDKASYILACFSDNYADEFDVNGWKALTKEEYLELVLKLRGYKKRINYYFGTNEELEWENGEDLLGSISFKPISQNTYNVLNKLFNGHYGMFPYIDDLEFSEEELEELLEE